MSPERKLSLTRAAPYLVAHRACRHHLGANKLIDQDERLPRALEFLDLEAERALSVLIQESWAQLSHVVVEAPPGKLGITFKHSEEWKSPVVSTLSAISPLRGQVGLEWRVLEVDGAKVSKMEPPEIAQLLLDRFNEPRTMKFDAGEAPKPKNWTLAGLCILFMALCIFVSTGQARKMGFFGDV